MSMDLRPRFSSALKAFGLPITVVPVNGAPVSATGVWLSSIPTDYPVGRELEARDPHRRMAIGFADVPSLPRGSTIEAPEEKGGTSRTWLVDQVDERKYDHLRVKVSLKVEA